MHTVVYTPSEYRDLYAAMSSTCYSENRITIMDLAILSLNQDDDVI